MPEVLASALLRSAACAAARGAAASAPLRALASPAAGDEGAAAGASATAMLQHCFAVEQASKGRV
jgi:hypothetical protein